MEQHWDGNNLFELSSKGDTGNISAQACPGLSSVGNENQQPPCLIAANEAMVLRQAGDVCALAKV